MGSCSLIGAFFEVLSCHNKRVNTRYIVGNTMENDVIDLDSLFFGKASSSRASILSIVPSSSEVFSPVLERGF